MAAAGAAAASCWPVVCGWHTPLRRHPACCLRPALACFAEIVGEQDYLARLAAARKASAVAEHLGEGALAACILEEGAWCLRGGGWKARTALSGLFLRKQPGGETVLHSLPALPAAGTPCNLCHLHCAAARLPVSRDFQGWLHEQPPSGIVSAALAASRRGLDALR